MSENRPLYALPRAADAVPKPPRTLKAKGQGLWRAVVQDFELEPYQLATLLEACRCLDTIELAEAAIRKEGVTIAGRFGPKANPACQTATQNRIVYSRLLRELGLDSILDTEASRPKPLYSGRRRN